MDITAQRDHGKQSGASRASPNLSTGPSSAGNPPKPSPSPTSTVASGPLSPHAEDRVFPVRSVVSVDPNATPMSRADTGEFPGLSNTATPIDPYSARARTASARRQSGASVPSTEPGSDVGSDASNVPHPGDLSRQNTEHRGREQLAWNKRSGAYGLDAREPTGQLRMPGQMRALYNDAASMRSENELAGPSMNQSVSAESADASAAFVTARFKHVAGEGGHLVLTGRDGDTLQQCEDEPIHIPGAVQGYGLLLAFREESDGKLSVRIVSENAQRVVGFTPRQLFQLDSLTDILSEEQTDNLLDHLDFIKDADSDPAVEGPEVFTLSVRNPQSRRLRKLWCAMHINPSNPDLVICELELEDDPDFPLVPAGSETPEPAEDTLQSNPTAEELAESTQNYSRPLRVLRTARKKKGEAAAMEVFNIMSQVQEQLASAPSLDKFLKVLVGVTKELTGFHRVMVYQFDSAWNGKVVTELVDPRATKDLYMGLNFPASDIPKQARDLYKVNKVRLLYDRDQETARLVCRTHADLERPLDLTYSYLRAMSPIHIKYLANMAVRSSMSISINAFGELWGLISCHSYGSKGTRVAFPIRKLCRLVGDSASRNIERLSYASRLQARKLINTIPTDKNPSGYIIATSDDLLKLFDADYGLLSIRDETKILGLLDATQEALALLEFFRLSKPTSVMTVQDVSSELPDLRYPPGFRAIAGALIVPLSAGGHDFIVFFRKGQLREVKWAGNPYEKFLREGTEGYLEPRKSFKTWSETIGGRSRAWTEEQIETAAVLCLVYGKFIEVWRQKEAAVHNSQLTRLLLANSAHEVRTPLNAIINCLEIALEGNLDIETRDNLSKSHSASKSLIYVINDLLDLTKTEEGKDLIRDDVFDLPETVKEATGMFINDAKRKNLEYEVVNNQGVPQQVVGDQRRVRQAICNVVANAIQHTSTGYVKIATWLVGEAEDFVNIDIAVEDTGTGMSPKKLDDLFMALEQVQSEDVESLVDASDTETKSLKGKPHSGPLGLGLAYVSRIVRNMNGQLRLKSEEGKGSRFVMQLRFDLPEPPRWPGSHRQDSSESTTIGSDETMQRSLPLPTPPVTEGEVVLVQQTPNKPITPTRPTGDLMRRDSRDSVHTACSNSSAKSMRSFRSGSSAKSDADRLIDAMQEPHLVASYTSAAGGSSMKSLTGDTSNTAISGKAKGSSDSRGSPAPIDRKSSMSRKPRDLPVMTSRTKPGEASVTDQATPVRPVRVPDVGEALEDSQMTRTRPKSANKVTFDIAGGASGSGSGVAGPKLNCLRVLVAEDDPVNSKILQKRLVKIGHEVHLTVNGEECASAHAAEDAHFDAVLMDMQVSLLHTS